MSLSQIGSDFMVAQLMKDPPLHNVSLLDFLRQHEDTFKLMPDGLTGGWTVRLHPGPEAVLPDAEAVLEPKQREANSTLPERIGSPGGSQQGKPPSLGEDSGTPASQEREATVEQLLNMLQQVGATSPLEILKAAGLAGTAAVAQAESDRRRALAQKIHIYRAADMSVVDIAGCTGLAPAAAQEFF